VIHHVQTIINIVAFKFIFKIKNLSILLIIYAWTNLLLRILLILKSMGFNIHYNAFSKKLRLKRL
jgi:hypothetical protein